MFNMGGPIKEGIMHGIREPYAGGQLVRPGPGRPGYAGEETFWSKLAAQYNPKNFASPKKFIQRINPFKKWKTATKVAPLVTKGVKDLRGIFVRKPPSSGITSSGAGQGFVKNLKDFSLPYGSKLKGWATRAKDLAIKYPKTTIAGGVGLTSDPAREAYKNIKPIGKWMAEAALPGWAERKILPWKSADVEDAVITAGSMPPGGGETALGSKEAYVPVPKLDDGSDKTGNAAEFAKAQRDARVKKYLDLMGYDRSKKMSIADALIDASKIVSDRGTLNRKNITAELINPIIQATSKRLDKPQQIREAVGLMMTKADLEKEMYDAKPGTVLKNVQDMVKSGMTEEEAWAIATKGSKGVVSDLQAAISTGKMSMADWPAFVRATGAEHGEDVTVITAEEIKENPEKYAKFKDKDIMEIVAGSPDGIYIIGSETVRIKGGKATQIR